MRQIILPFFFVFFFSSDGRQVYLYVTLSIISNLITHVCVSLSGSLETQES